MKPPPQTPTQRVLVVAPSHPSVNSAGSELAAHGVFSGLLEQGVDAVFLAPCRRVDRARLILGEREYVFDLEDGEYDVFYHLAAPELMERAFEAIFSLSPDVINFHHFIHIGLNTISKIQAELKVRIFFTLHEYLAVCFHNGQMVTTQGDELCRKPSAMSCHSCYPEISPQRFELRRNYILSVLDRCHALIAPSHFLASVFSSWGIRTPPIHVIENPVALPPRAPQRQHAGRPPVFGYFGQVTPYKGVDVLLKAAERLDAQSFEYELRIYGNIIPGVDAALIDHLSRLDGSLRSTYFGPYSNKDVGKLMAECDFVVMPSIWWENSPVVIQEALAVGRPVICADIGGMVEKVNAPSTGRHFKVGDYEDLARAMTQAAASLREGQFRNFPERRDDLQSARQKYSSILMSQVRSCNDA